MDRKNKRKDNLGYKGEGGCINLFIVSEQINC